MLIQILAVALSHTYLGRSRTVGSTEVADRYLMYPICNISQVGSKDPSGIDPSRPWRRVRIHTRDIFALNAATVQLSCLICRRGRINIERSGDLIAVHWSGEVKLDRDKFRREIL